MSAARRDNRRVEWYSLALDRKERGRDGLPEFTRRYVVFQVEIKIYPDVGSAQVRGRRERARLREQHDHIAMYTAANGRRR